MFGPDAASRWFWSTVLRYRSGLHCQVHMGVNKETIMSVLPVKVQVLLNLWHDSLPFIEFGDSVYQIGKNQSFKVIDIENRIRLSRGLGAAAKAGRSYCSRYGSRCMTQYSLAAGQHNTMLEMPSSWCMFYTSWKYLPSFACFPISCFQAEWSLPRQRSCPASPSHTYSTSEQKPKTENYILSVV